MKIEYDTAWDLLYIWFDMPGEKAVKTETVVPEGQRRRGMDDIA